MDSTEFDYIIVGAGTAGCVLANRLSKNPNKRVLLLEAGGSDNYIWIHIPVGYLYTIANPRTDWCYRTEPDPGLNERVIPYARGKVLGGCSSINAMIYMRGQRSDYDHWASLGNKGWSWDDVLPVFKRSENYQHGPDDYHGSDGELRVEERRVNWEILDAWRDAAEQAGIPKIEEFNRGDNFGNSYFQMNQRRGMRWSAVDAFLKPVRSRDNLTIISNALVNKLQIARDDRGCRATGVEVRLKNGNLKCFTAHREVVLAAGAIGSPQLLQLSGIGESAHLTNLGIKPLHHLPGVGRNLQDHLQVRSIYAVSNTTTLNQRYHSLWKRAAMGLEYLLFRTGPLTMPPSQLGAFAKSDSGQASPNIEWHVQPLSLDAFGEPLHSFDAITPSVCNLRPSSRGHVLIADPDPTAHPLITTNFLDTEEDRRVAAEGLRFTRRIMSAPALADFLPREILPGPQLDSDEELIRAAGDLGTTIFHPVGTCKMGSDEQSVVNDRLQVQGVKQLRVIDASIMPSITSGNTNAPTVMIAEKGAEFILNSLPS